MSAEGKNKLIILRKREEFLALAKSGRKWVAPGLIVQAAPTPQSGKEGIRFGLTASSKIGGAVVRNRARRRMRSLAHEIFPLHAAPGNDFVIIARAVTPKRDYADLRQDLITALRKLNMWRDA